MEVRLKLSDGWCFIFTLLLGRFGLSQKESDGFKPRPVEKGASHSWRSSWGCWRRKKILYTLVGQREERLRLKAVWGAGKWLWRVGSKHTTGPKWFSGLRGHCTELSSHLKKIDCWAAKKPRRMEVLQESNIIRGPFVANHFKMYFLSYLRTWFISIIKKLILLVCILLEPGFSLGKYFNFFRSKGSSSCKL